MKQSALSYRPPLFHPHLLLRSGHLQTLATLRPQRHVELRPVEHRISLVDGDQIVLHEDLPKGDLPNSPSLSRDGAKVLGTTDDAVLLVHGLCGCHAAGYLIRLADRLTNRGIRVFRMDMRGCGSGANLARNVTHAGRSDDILAALDWIANRVTGSLGAAGFSLGGNQVLRAISRIGAGHDATPIWFDRFILAAAVSPPIDLARCSENMMRRGRRVYSRYFIRHLLRRIPPAVTERSDMRLLLRDFRPKNLWDLDHQLTAPLSGFSSAADYYEQSSAKDLLVSNPIKTLILCTSDDPIVPIDSFVGDDAPAYHPNTELLIQQRGGHLGFVDRRGRCWMDEAISSWFLQSQPAQ